MCPAAWASAPPHCSSVCIPCIGRLLDTCLSTPRLKESADAKAIRVSYYKLSRQLHPVSGSVEAPMCVGMYTSSRTRCACQSHHHVQVGALPPCNKLYACCLLQDKNKNPDAPKKFQRVAKAYEASDSNDAQPACVDCTAGAP